MTRARLILLALCAGLLLSSGQRTAGGAGPPEVAAAPPPPRAEAPAGDPETHIGSVLGEHNPALSDEQLRRIAAAVMRYSAKYGLDPELVTAVLLVESGARPWARSPKGAIGLMQVMPYMAEPLGLAGNLATIESNIEAGCLILADNIRRRGEDEGILAYFWGSRIRGVSYLHRVNEAREAVRRHSVF